MASTCAGVSSGTGLAVVRRTRTASRRDGLCRTAVVHKPPPEAPHRLPEQLGVSRLSLLIDQYVSLRSPDHSSRLTMPFQGPAPVHSERLRRIALPVHADLVIVTARPATNLPRCGRLWRSLLARSSATSGSRQAPGQSEPGRVKISAIGAGYPPERQGQVAQQ